MVPLSLPGYKTTLLTECYIINHAQYPWNPDRSNVIVESSILPGIYTTLRIQTTYSIAEAIVTCYF